MNPTSTAPGPGLLDALALLAEVADELGVRTARDTHLAWAERVHGLLRRPTGSTADLPGALHRTIARGVYDGVGAGLRTVSRGLDLAAAHVPDDRWNPPLEGDRRGQVARSVVNGLIGDRLERERPQWAIPMAVRAFGADVHLSAESIGEAFPEATGRVAVFLHGLFEDEGAWSYRREQQGPTYAEALAGRGWTPVLLRANTGLGLRANGAALSGVLQSLTGSWPVPVERIALVGHSMGGLVFRAAADVVTDHPQPWAARVSDVVTLGTPHLGAPVAAGVGHGAHVLSLLPELAAFGRILDWRSVGVHDLVAGLSEDVAPLPHARYRLVAGTLTRSPRHPVGAFAGDLLVRVPSAHGRSRRRVDLFPGADVLHVPQADHFDLLNHPVVHTALEEWLA
jgi:pimeloyl-ACP methyl ester carboxylesterase